MKDVFSKEMMYEYQKSTREAFKGKIDNEQIEMLLANMPKDSSSENVIMVSSDLQAGDNGPLQADASLVSALIWSKVNCYPSDIPWKFEEQAWGPGIGGGSSIGFMYNTYEGPNSWDAFFKNTVAYHAQGIADMGGIFQINWFSANGIPTGQFNGVLAGAGVFEIGGSGHWKKK